MRGSRARYEMGVRYLFHASIVFSPSKKAPGIRSEMWCRDFQTPGLYSLVMCRELSKIITRIWWLKWGVE